MKLLLVGHGRMGQLVEQLAPGYGCEIVRVVTELDGPTAIADGDFPGVTMAIDFSTPEAVPQNLPQLVRRGISVVVGTTGWQDREAEFRALVAEAGVGVLAAANFSLGVHVFRQVVEEASRRFARLADIGAWIHEAHHAAKQDAPSGTALTLHTSMINAGYERNIDVSSTRAGWIPGTHTVGFDGRSETVTLTHTVRDRAVFAHGALEAARWLDGRHGWFTVADMMDG